MQPWSGREAGRAGTEYHRRQWGRGACGLRPESELLPGCVALDTCLPLSELSFINTMILAKLMAGSENAHEGLGLEFGMH